MDQLTNQFYAANTVGVGRTIQDFGLCDLKGGYVYTAKTRAKGLLVVVFFDPKADPSLRALKAVQSWTQDVPGAKWSALAVTAGDKDDLAAWAEKSGLSGVTVLLDHELYQTRQWGVSHLPSLYLIAGKTGRVLSKIVGDDRSGLDATGKMLGAEVGKIIAAEEAAKKADEEKKAAEAAAKAQEEASKAAAGADKPSEPKPTEAAKA